MKIKEKSILFKGPMVCAILEGKKTQTRRLLKPFQIPHLTRDPNPEYPNMKWIAVVQNHDRWGFAEFGATEEECAQNFLKSGGSPYMNNEKLWVRENFKIIESCIGCGGDACDCENFFVEYQADGATRDFESWDSEARFPQRRGVIPSIHMNRHLSRLTIQIKKKRIERLNDISDEDCIAEGFTGHGEKGLIYYLEGQSTAPSPRAHMIHLWNEINGPQHWQSNPWVFAYDFEVVK